MIGHDLNLKIRNFLALLTVCCGVTGAAGGQSAATVTPQSLAGDWLYAGAQLTLHLSVDARGGITGTWASTLVGTGTPMPISNAHLNGNVLTFQPPSSPPMSEVVAPDGKSMTGQVRFVKTVAKAAAPPAFPLAQVAGDWAQGDGGPSSSVLRLRLDASGALTGTLDTHGPIPTRTNLSNVVVTGNMLHYSVPDGNRFEGTFSGDGKTVTRTMQSTVDVTWHQVRVLAQATAQEVSDSTKPTNGVWSGTGSYIANYPGIGLRNGTMTLTFHFQSNPETCTVDMGTSDGGTPSHVPGPTHLNSRVVGACSHCPILLVGAFL